MIPGRPNYPADIACCSWTTWSLTSQGHYTDGNRVRRARNH